MARTYIAFENSKISNDDLAVFLKNDRATKVDLITTAYILAKNKKYDLDLSEYKLPKDFIYVDLDSVSNVLGIKKNTTYKRISRIQDCFKKVSAGSDNFLFFIFDINDAERNDEDTRSKSLKGRHSFDKKYRRTPPISAPPEVNLIVNSPFGDFTDLCVAANSIIYKKTFVITVKGKTKSENQKVVVIASGGNGINDANDMMTLYALLSSTIQYHTAYKNSFFNRDNYDENVTPIYADTILNMIGRSSSNRENREYLWKKIVRLRTTEYDIHSIKEFMCASDKKLFSNNQFRFIESSPSMSEEAVNLSTGLASPTFYEIKWHPLVFKSIIESKYFFAFPDAVFKEPVSIFSLYLHLRKIMRYFANGTVSFSRSELKDILIDESADYVFQRSFTSAIARNAPDKFKAEIKKVSETADVSKNKPVIVKRDLFGFKIAIEFTGKVSFSGITVKVDVDDVLKHSGVKKNKSGVSAPTLPNPIYRKQDESLIKEQPVQTIETLSEQADSGLSLQSLASKCRYLMIEVDGDILKSSYSVKVTMNKLNIKFIIISSTSNREIENFILEIMASYPRDFSFFLEFLMLSRDRLEGMSYYGMPISDDVIYDVVLSLNRIDGNKKASFKDVFEIAAHNRKLRAGLAKEGATEKIIDAISYMLP